VDQKPGAGHGDLSGILMVAIQELSKENVALKKQLAEQAAKEKAIEARLARLERAAPAAAVPVKVALKK
jgi:hypothetical protein